MRWIFSTLLLIAVTALATNTPGEKTNRFSTVTHKDFHSVFNEKLQKILLEKKVARFELGLSKKGRSIEAWFFPGRSDRNALVIGGVHGSELSAIEVAHTLITQLSTGESPYYNVIVVPSLFPDNAETAKQFTKEIGSPLNIGRYSFVGAPDPNRQMPTPGRGLDEELQHDHAGRKQEPENVLLLQLVEVYKPHRIASLHAIRDVSCAGFFADPRTDEKGMALGFHTDSSLAISMAGFVEGHGGSVPGNKLAKHPSALYFKDPPAAIKGNFQKRNFDGSTIPGFKGRGVSLGTWASTAIKDSVHPSRDRDAIRIITIEFPGSRRPEDLAIPPQREYCKKQIHLFAAAIHHIFLQEYFIEKDDSLMGRL
jgi:hypothetical protein